MIELTVVAFNTAKIFEFFICGEVALVSFVVGPGYAQSRISFFLKLQQAFLWTWPTYYETIFKLKKSKPTCFWRENWWYQGLRNGLLK